MLSPHVYFSRIVVLSNETLLKAQNKQRWIGETGVIQSMVTINREIRANSPERRGGNEIIKCWRGGEISGELK
jgi:hypothetical protein